MIYVTSAFSANMLPNVPMARYADALDLRVAQLTETEMRLLLIAHAGRWQSAVGHAGTAAVLSQRLGQNITANRANVRLSANDELLVCQVQLPRLAEGQVLSEAEVRDLPITYLRVRFVDMDEVHRLLYNLIGQIGDLPKIYPKDWPTVVREQLVVIQQLLADDSPESAAARAPKQRGDQYSEH